MIRTAVRSLTLNVYHGKSRILALLIFSLYGKNTRSFFSIVSDALSFVFAVGDESVNDYVVSPPHTEYFSKLVSFFQKQCIDLSAMVLNTLE